VCLLARARGQGQVQKCKRGIEKRKGGGMRLGRKNVVGSETGYVINGGEKKKKRTRKGGKVKRSVKVIARG
jgi:hypothetical protein